MVKASKYGTYHFRKHILTRSKLIYELWPNAKDSQLSINQCQFDRDLSLNQRLEKSEVYRIDCSCGEVYIERAFLFT